jgi:hypothetical protein
MGQEIHRVAYFSKIALVFVAFLLLRSPCVQNPARLPAYFSLMLVRDTITLKDTFALYALRNSAASSPEISA